ncbi:hypothetical protein GE09DRAFT_1216693 [Coniochaeta sp. 2T2.1]|nr:hypothetical protein GE09DRAFT_1216693 [Coniochaeta sp. 2T2.1]
MHQDGAVDNAFPWMSPSNTASASTHNTSPYNNVSPNDTLIPPTPGWIPPTPGVPPTPGIPPPPPPGVVVDPPRQAREGYEWVWFPDGFWAEREITTESPSKGSGLDSKIRRWKGKSSKGSQGSVDLDVSPLPRRGSGGRRGSGQGSTVPFAAPTPHTPFRTERELVQALQHSSDNSGNGADAVWGYPFTAMSPSAERNYESGSSPASTVTGFRRGSWPETQTILEEKEEDETGSQGSGTPLGRLKALGKTREKRKSRSAEKGPPESEAHSDGSDGHSAGQPSNARKLLNKLSWRKKESPADSDSLSLIEEEGTFTKESSHSFWDSVYPGGEARRITTPPLKEATADGRVRSLFTEVDNFGPDEARSDADNRSQMSTVNNGGGGSTGSHTVESSSEGSKLNMAYRKAAAADATGGGHIHWFDSKKEEDEKKKQLLREKKKNMKKHPGGFSLAMPEHLPNSPLCPANPKNPSGGTGVCVFHGRRQDISGTKQQPFVAELGLQQPTPKS